mmetsp:Transcript_8480/g.16856  ORF Transcript_8480/g.16856 Transcript_8480/m.16856 type:complete len:93 (-) Transcript_8480:642-920(-)
MMTPCVKLMRFVLLFVVLMQLFGLHLEVKAQSLGAQGAAKLGDSATAAGSQSGPGQRKLIGDAQAHDDTFVSFEKFKENMLDKIRQEQARLH